MPISLAPPWPEQYPNGADHAISYPRVRRGRGRRPAPRCGAEAGLMGSQVRARIPDAPTVRVHREVEGRPGEWARERPRGKARPGHAVPRSRWIRIPQSLRDAPPALLLPQRGQCASEPLSSCPLGASARSKRHCCWRCWRHVGVRMTKARATAGLGQKLNVALSTARARRCQQAQDSPSWTVTMVMMSAASQCA